ncbi:MAG TPA: VOC family protein [Polyangia bacterium]
MAGKVKAVPDGYHTVTPYLIVRNASEAIAFYQRALGAKELYRMDMSGGKVAHAELQIGDSRLMISDEMPASPESIAQSPKALGGTTMGLNVYLEDVDARVADAVKAGATIRRPLQNQFYGDRSATIEDPFGHVWTLSTHVEDVSPEEMERRMAQMGQGH